MTKKERVIAVINREKVEEIPSSFSLHFPKNQAAGEAAIEAHIKFLEETDTDILKIMNENLVPHMGEVKNAQEYGKVYGNLPSDKVIDDQIDLTKRILERCDPDVFTIATLHGVVGSSMHPLRITGLESYDFVRQLLLQLLREDPEPVLKGMKRITQVMCELAKEYIDCGVDGIYYAGLGGETKYFTDEEFANWVEPFDKMIMTAIREAGGYCFLHICKDGLNMDRYKDYGDYADVINWGVYEAPFSLEDGKKMFPGKAIMGGLPSRTGVLVDGTDQEIREAVKDVIASFEGESFILGADCTLDTEQPTDKIRVAVEAARE